MNLEREMSRKTKGRRKKRNVQRMTTVDTTPRFFVDKRKIADERAESHLQKQVALLAAQERKVPADSRYSSGRDIAQMIGVFSRDPEFQSIVDESRLRLMRGVDFQEVKADLNGAVFENLVYRILKSESPEGLTVLSPDRAFKVARMMYPNARDNHSGLSHLHGLVGDNAYIPDGFIVSEGEGGEGIILASIEASTQTQERRFNISFKNKYNKFRNAKRTYGVLAGSMQMMIVRPQNNFTPVIANKPDVAMVNLDFQGQEFAVLVREAASL